MTDYASQDHLSYYTALSRSSTSDGTVIVQGMNPARITNGINGYLRQDSEFRELEVLNEITRQRFEEHGSDMLTNQRVCIQLCNGRVNTLSFLFVR
ncbi:hypothetical protein R3P38DRAFT_3155434 [Favolaschia claudopus]|uniref:Uncharacterized protein n=1 Tax=Favolaschia claudopus TaxID=2862362 RepID=A0AAV9YZC5_9AGAR